MGEEQMIEDQNKGYVIKSSIVQNAMCSVWNNTHTMCVVLQNPSMHEHVEHHIFSSFPGQPCYCEGRRASEKEETFGGRRGKESGALTRGPCRSPEPETQAIQPLSTSSQYECKYLN